MENIFVEFLPPWIETGRQPAFYDKESGTVLQQTARMYDRVNMLVRMFNKLSKETKTVVEEYIGKFDELHDYVMDYFDNLDVQEEINNKLDDMVEQGTLQEIIADYLNSKAVFGFDSVSAMKSATNFVDGSYAETLGYFSKNDGGNATYKIRKMTNDDVVDEKFIIEITGDPSNELIAELIHDEEINVLQMGITEDNFSDCVNMLIGKEYKVYIPKGEYVAKSPITVNKNNTQITCDGDITFNFDDILVKVTSFYNILKFNGTYIGNDTDDCTFMKVGIDKTVICNNIYIHKIEKFGTGLELNTSTAKGIAYCKFDFDLFTVSKYGILFNQGAGANFINENYFSGGYINGTKSSVIGIKMIKGNDQTDAYNGNVFEHIAIETHYDTGIDLEYAYYNHFENMRLSEGLDGSYYINLNDCRYNYFSTKSPTKVTNINDTETDANAVNYFNILGCDHTFIRIANKFKSVKGKFVAEAIDSVNGYGNANGSFAYNSTTSLTEPDMYLDGGSFITIGHDDSNSTLEYALPSVFGDNGVKSFYIRFSYFSANDNPVIQDSNGNTIADRTQFGSGALSGKIFRLDFIGSVAGNRWVVIPVEH